MSTSFRIAAFLALVLTLAACAWRIHVKADATGFARAEAVYTAAIEKQNAQAAATLASETSKARSAEQALNQAKNRQELKDATHQKTVADLSDRLRSLAGPAGRLRDPNGDSCGPGGGSPSSEPASAAYAGAADAATPGGLLSAPLSGLLQQLTREADHINTAYASCRADAYTVRGTVD